METPSEKLMNNIIAAAKTYARAKHSEAVKRGIAQRKATLQTQASHVQQRTQKINNSKR